MKKADKRLLDESLTKALAPRRPKKDMGDILAEYDDGREPPPPTTTPSTHLIPPPTKLPTAPERDFTRVANSIARDAMPAGLFKGTSKKTYDALYQKTRGAIRPSRTIKVKHGQIREWAKVSHNTLREHLRHLEAVGLISCKWELGDNAGAVYEVFIPEEIAPSSNLLPPPTTTSTSDQNLVSPSTQNLVKGGGSQIAIESTTSGGPQTLIQDLKRSDDEPTAFSELFALAEQLTGKPAPSRQWDELSAVLSAELRIAAARTTVSNVPAFLAEHLRRRLFKDKAKLIEGAENALRGQIGPGKGISECAKCGGDGYYFDDPSDAATFNLCRHGKD